jgi:hypothetical protein
LVGNESLVSVHFQEPIKNLVLPKPYIITQKLSEFQYVLRIPDEEPLSKLIEIFQKNNYLIQEINREKPELGEAIKKMYEGRNDI